MAMLNAAVASNVMRSRADRGPVPAGLQHRLPGGHHIELILGVRFLVVDAAGRDRVSADAQVGDAEVLGPVVRARPGRPRELPGTADHLHPSLLRWPVP